MLVSPLPPFFLDSYSLSRSSLGCKALCNVISFLVLWSICWSSSLVHFKNGPKNLTRGYPSRLSLWWYSCYVVWFRVVFSFSLYPLLKFFRSSLLVWWYPIFQSICRFPFLQASWFFLCLVVLFVPSCVVSGFTLLTWRIFLCKIPSLCFDCLFPQPVLGFPILFHFWQTVWCRSCTLGGWFFFSSAIL